MIFGRTHSRFSRIAVAGLAGLCLLSGVMCRGRHDAVRGTVASTIAPGQAAATGLAQTVRGFFSWLVPAGSTARELEEAREEIRRLRDQLTVLRAELDVKERALQTLSETLEVFRGTEQPKPELIAASIVGRDATNWSGIAVLDRGSADGIVVGSGVISGQAVVGVVAAVRPSASVVRLLSHPRCRVACSISRTGESRHVTGTLTDMIRMLDVHEKPVLKGDIVRTSGEMGLFPRGLLVGTVVRAERPEGSLSYDVRVRPAAQLSVVRDVLVVQPRSSDALELIQQQGR